MKGHRTGRRSIGCILMLCLLLCACSSRDEAGEGDVPATLNIYVYSPENPMLTRGSTDFVDPVAAEGGIYSLQIWVFETENGHLVGYFTPASVNELNASKSAVYQMTVTPQFAHDKPNVDVYVLANITEATCGCSFDEHTSRETLEQAVLRYVDDGHDYFGLTGQKVTAVPSTGLPVSGMLKNQPVTGDSPVLRVGDGALATVQLVRAVSKVRFIFSQMKNEEAVLSINSVSLKGDKLLSKREYLFLEGSYSGTESHIDSDAGYQAGAFTMATDIGVVASCVDPMYYAYTNQEAQEYENLIASGLIISDGGTSELTQVGPFYLRETDQKLTGEIKYSINNGEERTATFSMLDAGDFSRNHTWIVYAFYGTTRLEVIVVRVKEWEVVEDVNRELYNW